MSMLIEKDKYLDRWVVWLIEGSLYTQVYDAKYKKDCKEWVKKNEKRVLGKIRL